MTVFAEHQEGLRSMKVVVTCLLETRHVEDHRNR